MPIRRSKRKREERALGARSACEPSVVPTPSSRQGIAEFPRQLRAAGPWLAELERRVHETLTDRPIVLIQGRKDPAVGRDSVLQRWQDTFPDHRVVVLPEAGHYFQEDAPEAVVDAIIDRFGAKG